MFYLIGLGVGPAFVTERAVEVLREVDCLFYEDYTGPVDLGVLSRLARAAPVRLSRRDLEEESGEKILRCLTEGKKTALVSAGDPHIATTHSALVSLIKARGHGVEIVPGVSIVCAAFSVSCLSIYRLGGVATVTYPRGGVYSSRPYEVAERNLSRGFHTLLLLDVRESGGFMPPSDAARVLLELERREGRNVFTPEREVIVVYRVGWGGGVVYSTLGEIASSRIEPPAVLIIPAKLNPVERECLEALWRR